MIIPTQRRIPAWRVPLWSAAALLLALPWVAMQFTREVQWGLGDFLVFGALLASACGAFEVAVRLTTHLPYRWWAGVVIALAFLLVWAELAVGIFH